MNIDSPSLSPVQRDIPHNERLVGNMTHADKIGLVSSAKGKPQIHDQKTMMDASDKELEKLGNILFEIKKNDIESLTSNSREYYDFYSKLNEDRSKETEF